MNTIQQTYLVSAKITPADEAEIDGVERALGVLPPGYRDYLRRFGQQGEYEGAFYVKQPQYVLRDTAGDRRCLLGFAGLDAQGYADWPDDEVAAEGATISRAEINQAFILGGNDNGDRIAFTPLCPGSVFVFHRHSEHVTEVEGGFLDPLPIAFDGQATDCFRFFRPTHADIAHHNIFLSRLHPNETVSRWTQEYWGVDDRYRVAMPESWDGRDPYVVFAAAIGGMCTILNDPPNREQYVQVMYDAKEHQSRVVDFERWLKARDQ